VLGNALSTSGLTQPSQGYILHSVRKKNDFDGNGIVVIINDNGLQKL
jgi:hypothetical protein